MLPVVSGFFGDFLVISGWSADLPVGGPPVSWWSPRGLSRSPGSRRPGFARRGELPAHGGRGRLGYRGRGRRTVVLVVRCAGHSRRGDVLLLGIYAGRKYASVRDVCLCACGCGCECVCACPYCMHIRSCIHMRTHAYHACMSVSLHACMFVCAYLCMYHACKSGFRVPLCFGFRASVL